MNAAMLRNPRTSAHLIHDHEAWYAADRDRLCGDVIVLSPDAPTGESPALFTVTQTWLTAYRESQLALPDRHEVFALAHDLARSEELGLPVEPVTLFPGGGFVTQITPRVNVTWRIDDATGVLVLLTLTVVP